MDYNLHEVILLSEEIKKHISANSILYKMNPLSKGELMLTNYEFNINETFEKWVKHTLESVYESKQQIAFFYSDKHNDSFFGGYFQLEGINNLHIVIINDRKNTCWKRFIVIKELCQIYLDQGTKNIINKSGNYNIDKTTNYIDCANNISHFSDSFNSNEYLRNNVYDNEMCALLMAIELMVPYEYREKHTSSIYDLIKDDKNEVTMYDLAYMLKIPEYIIKRFMESGLFDLSNELHKTLKFA